MKKILIRIFLIFIMCIPGYAFASDVNTCNHVIVTDYGYPPTCTAYGLSDGKHCKLCGEVLVKQFVLKPRHNGKFVEKFEPTCTRTGQEAGMFCLDCNRFYEGGKIIPAIGHKFTEIPETKPTCTRAGLTRGKCCSVCNWYSIPQKKIPASHQGNTRTVITKATLKENGKIEKKCDACDTVLSKEKIYKIRSVKLKDTIYSYDGSRKSPIVIVTDSKGNTFGANYYSIEAITNCKSVGKHIYKVKFKGNYKGCKNVSFRINPQKTVFKSVVKRKTSLTFKWRKVSKQITGYEIRYSTNNKFKKNTTKIFKIKQYNKTEQTIHKLKSKKTYYAKIRTYKVVKGKIYYSSWSNVVNVRTL